MTECNYFKSCALCGSKVKNVETHLSETHEINVEVKFLRFRDLDEFHEWKENLEKETVSRYVKQYGAKKRKDGRVVIYYHCHRDGNYVPKGRNKRSLKKIGSNKINGTCPSLIKAEQDGGILRVRFVATHVGHTCDIGRMVFPTTGKSQISTKIGMKAPLKDILSGIKDSGAQLISKGDARNTAQCNLVEKHNSNDAKISHCIKEVEIQEVPQLLSDREELVVADLELSKQSLIEQVGKVILNIETVGELIAVEKFLKPLEEVVSAAKNFRKPKEYLSVTEVAGGPLNKRIFPQQKFLSNQEHDHLYPSLKEPVVQCKRPFISKTKDSARKQCKFNSLEQCQSHNKLLK